MSPQCPEFNTYKTELFFPANVSPLPKPGSSVSQRHQIRGGQHLLFNASQSHSVLPAPLLLLGHRTQHFSLGVRPLLLAFPSSHLYPTQRPKRSFLNAINHTSLPGLPRIFQETRNVQDNISSMQGLLSFNIISRQLQSPASAPCLLGNLLDPCCRPVSDWENSLPHGYDHGLRCLSSWRAGQL